MANENDTKNSAGSVDAGDLDGIDALLDEAELESLPDDLVTDDFEMTDFPELDNEASTNQPDETEVLLDDLESDLEDFTQKKEAPEVKLTSESSVEEIDAKPNTSQQSEDEQPESKGFLQKTSKSTATNELTVAEMDALKKLIMTFGSVLIVLVLVAISMGLWVALASGKGLDEESVQMLEDIKVGSEEHALKAVDLDKHLQDIEKKIDSLTFQIGLLTTDLSEMGIKSAPPTGSIQAINLASEMEASKPKLDRIGRSTVAVQQVDPEFIKRLTQVNSRIVTSQKRIAEVNRRVKDLQNQHKTLLRSMKNIEKEMAKQRLETAKKLAKERQEQQKKLEEKESKPPAYQLHPREGRYYW